MISRDGTRKRKRSSRLGRIRRGDIPLRPLPAHVKELLKAGKARLREVEAGRTGQLAQVSDFEALVERSIRELETDFAKPVKVGSAQERALKERLDSMFNEVNRAYLAVLRIPLEEISLDELDRANAAYGRWTIRWSYIAGALDAEVEIKPNILKNLEKILAGLGVGALLVLLGIGAILLWKG